MNRRVAVLLALSLPSAACAFEALDYTGKKCPCPAPWTCDEDAGVCENAGGGSLDGAAVDVTRDGTSTSEETAGRDAEPDSDGDSGSTEGPLDASHVVTWCNGNAPDALLCCDFDEEKLLTDDWFQRKDPAGTTLDTNRYESPFQSLRAAAPPAAADGGVYEAYVQPAPWNELATALHFGLDLLVDIPDGSFVTVAQVGLVPPGGPANTPTRTLSLLVYNRSAILQEQVDLADGGRILQQWSALSPPPTGTGTWSRVELDVVLETDAAAGQCSLLIDSNLAVSPQTLTPGWTSEVPTITAGIVYSNGPLTDASVNIDNVTLYVR